jgi:hypothetical protein
MTGNKRLPWEPSNDPVGVMAKVAAVGGTFDQTGLAEEFRLRFDRIKEQTDELKSRGIEIRLPHD